MLSQPHDPRASLENVGDVVPLLDQLADVGFATSLRPAPPPGSLRCSACASVSKVTDFDDFWGRRFEGTSDPDDMVLVVAARCPVCGHGGTIVLGFGPLSSPEDAAIVAELPDHVMRSARPRI